MKLICKLSAHRPGPEVWNEGLCYAVCTRCGTNIIRQQGCDWSEVPAGLRVAWHPTGHQGMHWSKAISRARESGLPEETPKPPPVRIG